MNTFSLIEHPSRRKVGEPTVSPFVQLSLKSYAEKEGNVLVSAQLMSDKEIDEVVERLTSELAVLKRDAKRKLRILLQSQMSE